MNSGDLTEENLRLICEKMEFQSFKSNEYVF